MSNNSLKLAWSTSFTITSLFLFWSDHQLTPVDCHAKDSKWCTQKLFRMTLSVKWYQQLSQECSEAWPGLSSPKFDLFFSSVLQYKSESLASESDPIFPTIFKIYTFHERAIFRIVWTWVQMGRGLPGYRPSPFVHHCDKQKQVLSYYVRAPDVWGLCSREHVEHA